MNQIIFSMIQERRIVVNCYQLFMQGFWKKVLLLIEILVGILLKIQLKAILFSISITTSID